ncbi:hypothetical protein CVCC1112_880 [Paenarthrobacter nicotinovorans]|nr:hypothetical protein ANMWB30_27540 [Arthrobacter sp. MWB30]GAT86220.1 hypothetical protein CVCC1112_880 [Paenarthrobacter nicotinovorans]
MAPYFGQLGTELDKERMRGPGHGAGTSPEYRIRAVFPVPARDVTAGPEAM